MTVPRYCILQRSPQGASQQAGEATELKRGPAWRRTLWAIPQPRCNPLKKLSSEVDATEFKWKRNRKGFGHHHTKTPHQHAPAKPQQADRVEVCYQMEPHPQQIQVPMGLLGNNLNSFLHPQIYLTLVFICVYIYTYTRYIYTH